MTFAVFSILSLNVPEVRLRSLMLRERRITRRLEPLATTEGEKGGLGALSVWSGPVKMTIETPINIDLRSTLR